MTEGIQEYIYDSWKRGGMLNYSNRKNIIQKFKLAIIDGDDLEIVKNSDESIKIKDVKYEEFEMEFNSCLTMNEVLVIWLPKFMIEYLEKDMQTNNCVYRHSCNFEELQQIDDCQKVTVFDPKYGIPMDITISKTNTVFKIRWVDLSNNQEYQKLIK